MQVSFLLGVTACQVDNSTRQHGHMICATAVVPELMLLLPDMLITCTEAIQSSWYHVYTVDGNTLNPELCIPWSHLCCQLMSSCSKVQCRPL